MSSPPSDSTVIGGLARDADGLQERLLAHALSASEAESARMSVAPTGAAPDKLRGHDEDPAFAVGLRAGCLEVFRSDLEGQGRPGKRKTIDAPERVGRLTGGLLGLSLQPLPDRPNFSLDASRTRQASRAAAARKRALSPSGWRRCTTAASCAQAGA